MITESFISWDLKVSPLVAPPSDLVMKLIIVRLKIIGTKVAANSTFQYALVNSPQTARSLLPSKIFC